MAELDDAVTEALRRTAAGELGCAVQDTEVTSVRRLSGGASRLTFQVVVAAPQASAELSIALQLERAGSVGTNLPMAVQVALLRSAHDVGVPVPRVLASGEGFVALEWIAGEALPRRVMADPALAGARSVLARDAGRVLAELHRIDPGRHPQLRSADELEQMRSLLDALGEPHPAFEIALAFLEEHRPPPRAEVVVHGDFRMGNLLVGAEGITAVLDWELAHLGSPVEDIGWFCGRAWRFGSPLRAGGVGGVEELLAGYSEGGGVAPGPQELDWWEVYGTLRWGLICVLQASVHLRGLHRSVELAAIGRRAAECEEDLLELVSGPSDYDPEVVPDDPDGVPRGAHDRPTAVELLDAVGEQLTEARDSNEGATAFHLRVSANVVAMVAREVEMAPRIDENRRERLELLGVGDETELAAQIRSLGWSGLEDDHLHLVRQAVRDKLAVSNPGYWRGDL